jgi:hypothetical protein
MAGAVALLAPLSLMSAFSAGPPAGAAGPTYLSGLGAPVQVGSTVPLNGDLNPYGIAVVTQSMGNLVAGDTLISNFNNSGNLQGTGTTLVEVSPGGGAPTLFSQITPGQVTCPGGIGLTTALAILPGGWVVVGSVPADANGNLPDVSPGGCLIVLNNMGVPVTSFTNGNLNGPWDMTATSSGSSAELYVANALYRSPQNNFTAKKGLCTVTRVDVSLSGPMPAMTGSTVIGRGFACQANAGAFVQGPTGVALATNGSLYVAETVTNAIIEIPNAATASKPVQAQSAVVSSGGALNGPLGLTLAPNGDLIAANGNDGNVVEIAPTGQQVAVDTLIDNGAGDLFGLTTSSAGLLFVNDGTNALDIAPAT